jgi:ATP-dependent RNA helicase HelY
MTDAGVDDDQLTPAERMSAAKQRTAMGQTPLGRFRQRYTFDLDPFQIEACTALQEGRGVLVAAPTGSGKTVVGEFAVELALETGRKAFYTTPIKALSNQKYADLVRRHGPDAVGLLTGDNTVNGEAPIVVMTTEVLRNMLYAGSPTLNGLGYVVMDEVHYLADRFRGAVWEEVIIHLPDDVLVVSLSATVSNAEEFGAWLDTVRGDTAVVVSEHRPVPLWQHVLVGRQLHDLFTTRSGEPLSEDALVGSGPDASEVTVNTELRRLARDDRERGSGRGDRGYRGRGGRPQHGGARKGIPSRAEVIGTLDAAGLLPAITFIFSRAGCEQAVQQCLAWGVRLTTPAERDEIRAIVDARCVDIPDQDLGVLGYWEWTEALGRGVAAHHAGLLPAFKEVVEELFTRGLIKAVFATETLALGINMPARSVVLEKLVKWNGQNHADITPGEYTQLTGRAGRRGIDVEGHAVVVWHQGIDPEAVGGLASTRTYPLRSSFRPTYNMAVNLVGQVGRSQAREILETSFAQFQADRAVVGLATQLRRQEEALEGYAKAMRCHLGDFTEYAALRQRISERETELARGTRQERRLDTLASLEKLRRGDVIHLPGGRRAGWAVVIESGPPASADGPHLTILTADRQVRRISLLDVRAPLEPAARVPIPKTFSARSPQSRRDLASSLRNALGTIGESSTSPAGRPRGPRGAATADDERLSGLRRELRAHPCHGCSEREDHARWAERWWRLEREREQLARRIEGRTNTIARTFDRVCELLTERGYLVGDTVTPHGERLRRLYAESDLLVAECLREGIWDGLDGAQLAACVSALVYEARREEGLSPRIPGGKVSVAMQETIRVWSALDDRERELKLEPTPEPDAGIAWAIHRWATGARLEDVLADTDLAAGDFVRWCKQIIDLLGQIQLAESAGRAKQSGLASHSLAAVAIDAVERIRRGVVAYSSVV